MNQQWREAQEYVEARAAALRQRPYLELAALPEVAEELPSSPLPGMVVTVYRESLENQAVRVRVQASRHYLGGIMSRSAVAGFDIRPNGEIADIPEGEYE